MKKTSKTKTINETPVLRRMGIFNKAAVGALALLLGTGLSALAGGNDNRAPEVPVEIAVPSGNKVHFHGFAVGFQIYTWDGLSWGRAVPQATLFDDEGNIVATHFAGPRWQSNSGSIVLGTLAKPPITVDPNSIPWLLLSAVAAGTEGPGIFADTSFIQRVNTPGGNAPSADGTVIGQVAPVPYTADYFFYRQTN